MPAEGRLERLAHLPHIAFGAVFMVQEPPVLVPRKPTTVHICYTGMLNHSAPHAAWLSALASSVGQAYFAMFCLHVVLVSVDI